MNSQVLNLAEEILSDEEDFIVPIKRVWLKISLDGKLNNIQFNNFFKMLEHDLRFEVFENNENSLFEEKSNVVNKSGFFAGPRVMLKSRKPNRQELGSMLIQKTNLIFNNLIEAWNLRHKENAEQEDELLNVLASTQKLLRTLKSEFPESCTN